MIALLGGVFNGKYLDRARPAPGSTIRVRHEGQDDTYVMRADGVAESEPLEGPPNYAYTIR